MDATRPALAFALEDLQESAPRRGQLALERLVFKCGGEGHPCVAASERETGAHSADMMSYFTSCGCPAETAYTPLWTSSRAAQWPGRAAQDPSAARGVRRQAACRLQTGQLLRGQTLS